MVRFSISSRTSDSEPSGSFYGEASRQFAISKNTHTIPQSGENVKRKNSITADPATYDDNGNLIPLSERFNQNRDDIRYSITADMKRNVDNLFVHFDEAKGKSRKEIFEQYDSTLKDVARLPFDMNFPEGLKVKKTVVKCAEAFFLDYAHNHKHEKEYTIEDYKRGFTLISPKNEMRIVSQQGSSSLAFIAKNPASGWDCVVIAPKRGEFFIYKTMFGQKRKPYRDKPMVRFSISSRTSDSEPSTSLYGETSRQFAISKNTHTIPQSGENVKRENSIAASVRTGDMDVAHRTVTSLSDVAATDPGAIDFAEGDGRYSTSTEEMVSRMLRAWAETSEAAELGWSQKKIEEIIAESQKLKKDDRGYTSNDYLTLYETLHDLGFVVPCKGCFDAAMRLKMLPSVAQKFVKEVNDAIDERTCTRA